MWDLALKYKKAFPTSLSDEVNFILKNSSVNESVAGYPVTTFPIVLNDEIIEIPVRHGLQEIEPSFFLSLTETQQNIIDCFYTRHCDGFKREQHLKRIIQINQAWVVPYVMQLVGEYVIEILNVIYENMSLLNLEMYKEFIQKNPEFYELTQARVTSYWNEYYRGYESIDLYHSKHGPSDKFKFMKQDYVGFKILATLSE